MHVAREEIQKTPAAIRVVLREAAPCRVGAARGRAPRGVYTLERTGTDEFRLSGGDGARFLLSCDAIARLMQEGRLALAA